MKKTKRLATIELKIKDFAKVQYGFFNAPYLRVNNNDEICLPLAFPIKDGKETIMTNILECSDNEFNLFVENNLTDFLTKYKV